MGCKLKCDWAKSGSNSTSSTSERKYNPANDYIFCSTTSQSRLPAVEKKESNRPRKKFPLLTPIPPPKKPTDFFPSGELDATQFTQYAQYCQQWMQYYQTQYQQQINDGQTQQQQEDQKQDQKEEPQQQQQQQQQQ